MHEFRENIDIARYQIRYMGGRWVVCGDVYDYERERSFCHPLMFGDYNSAYIATYRLCCEYEGAGLVVPDFELVGIDFRSSIRIVKKFRIEEMDHIGNLFGYNKNFCMKKV